jgi:hypothetical protein
MNKSNQQQNKPSKKAEQDKKPAIKPDEETLHTTDPQEHMEGPISSILQTVKENVDETGGERKPEDETNS